VVGLEAVEVVEAAGWAAAAERAEEVEATVAGGSR